ncbi:MAG: hypothetical protein U9N73_04905 [Candidatus Auribacterota bacterium]|nr:hypothetical protein [Candidatus Auribacterota bacterium]
MKENLKSVFTYADIFRVVQYTLDHKRLVIQALGLLLSLLAFFGLFSLGYRVQGELTFLPWFYRLLALIAFYLINMIFAGPVTYLILEEIKSGRRSTISGSLLKGLKYGLRLALAPLGVLTFLLASGVVLILLICLGMIPEWGPVLWSALFIPQFVLALFLIIGVVTLVAETLLLPSIIIYEDIPASRAFAVLYKLMRRRFLVFWGYTFTAIFLNIIYFLLFTTVIFSALAVLLGISSLLLGNLPGEVILSMPTIFHRIPSYLTSIVSFPSGVPPESWAYPLSGYLGGFSLLFVYICWLSYPILYGFNSGVIIYLALREKLPPPVLER